MSVGVPDVIADRVERVSSARRKLHQQVLVEVLPLSLGNDRPVSTYTVFHSVIAATAGLRLLASIALVLMRAVPDLPPFYR